VLADLDRLIEREPPEASIPLKDSVSRARRRHGPLVLAGRVQRRRL